LFERLAAGYWLLATGVDEKTLPFAFLIFFVDLT